MPPMLHRSRCLWLLLPLIAGCAGVPAPVESRLSPCAARGIVFVVDGAGGYQHAPRASIAAAADDLRLSLYVRSFDWTHGRGRGLADMLDLSYSCRQGQLLAEEICRYRSQYPGLPIYPVAAIRN